MLTSNGRHFYYYEARDTDEKTPIHIAAYSGHTDIVKYFVVDKKIPIDWPDGYPCGFMWV